MARAFSFNGRVRSVRHAMDGVWLMLRTQHNAWIHAVATALVIGAGITFRVSGVEWALLVLAIMAVWSAEALNTALEHIADVASPEFHPVVGRAKDVAAGAVLIAAIGSAVVGLLVLGPHFLGLLRDAT